MINKKKPDKSLVLIDAYALIFRAYFAFIRNPRINSKGMNTSAIFGFVNTLEDILRRENPSHIAVAFDPPGPNFRHAMFPEYKAHRDATPEDIKMSVPYIKNIIQGFNIPILEVDGFEADDVIGTMASKAEEKGFDVYMVTPDKDFAQLVSDHIFMLKPSRGGADPEIWTMEEVKRIFHVEHPDQVRDILALWGDAADNIPGAPGIGEKTSKKLIEEYGSVENLIKNTHELKGKQKENILQNIDQILMSKELATINKEVPIEFDEQQYKKKEPDKSKLETIFNELEFRTITKRILGEKPPDTAVQTSLFDIHHIPDNAQSVSDFDTIDTVAHEYHIIQSDNERAHLIQALADSREFCFDTETTGLNILDDEMVGMAFSIQPHKAYYLPLPDNRHKAEQILGEFRSLFLDRNKLKIGQNLKYDLHILKNYGLDVEGPYFDTMVAHYLLDPDQRHNLNHLAQMYLNYSPVTIEELIGEKGKDQKNMREVELQTIAEYAAEDADLTYQLSQIFRSELEKQKLSELSSRIEMPLVPVLFTLERRGVKLDTHVLDEFAVTLKQELAILETDIFSLAGTEFNISSPKQLGEVLFEKLKIISDARKTKTQQYSTSEDVLMRLKEHHPIVHKVLEYRSLKKLLSTYVEALPKMIRPDTHKIHTSFNQTIAATGRLSSVNPNLQNIPIRGEKGREIRKAFIPSETDFQLLSADYSQIELRLMAHLSKDEALCRAFIQNEDIHRSTASKIYSVPLENVSREMRSRAKTANFGIIYGISAFGLSQRLNISRGEAKELIDGYFNSYPGVKRYMDESISRARENGFVQTLFGRRRMLKDIHSRNAVVRGMAERNAINAPIQGSAADIIKLAMNAIHHQIREKNLKSRMILQVHDELVFDVWNPEKEELIKLVIHEMEHVYQLEVPLVAEYGMGGNWLEAHD